MWIGEIEDSPFESQIGIIGGVVVTIRSPKDDHSVSVLLEGALADGHQLKVEAPPSYKVETRNALHLGFTDLTVTGLIREGESESRYFSLGSKEYRLTLQKVEKREREGGPVRVYHFFLREEPVGSSASRATERSAALREIENAGKIDDLQRIVTAIRKFAELGSELATSAAERKLATLRQWDLATAHVRLFQYEEGRRELTRLIEHLISSPFPDGDEMLANAIGMRGDTFEREGRYAEALADFCEVERRFQSRANQYPIIVAQSLLGKMYALRNLQRVAESRAVAGRLVELFGAGGNSGNSRLDKLVDEAKTLLRDVT